MALRQQADVHAAGRFGLARVELDHGAQALGPTQPPQLIALECADGERDVAVLVPGRKLARHVQPYRIERITERDQPLPFPHRDFRGGGASSRLAAAGLLYDHHASRSCTLTSRPLWTDSPQA